ncbi:MAG: BamA/TamA family outer membrane protein [Balneolaceae bacterium]|nr:BamA/TamA family outer membrane protein [Balneolaceae bacterium]
MPTIAAPVKYSLFLGMLMAMTTGLYAQDNQSETDTTDAVVRVTRFVGNDHVKDNTLETLIRTRTNREFLGISRFTPWYAIWRLTNGTFGEPPVRLDRQTVATDIERIDKYYESIGFLDVAVDTNIVYFKEDKVEVSFLIREGNRYHIKSVTYTGMPDFERPGKVQNFYRDSPLTGDLIDDSTYTVNRFYSDNSLTQERNRIITFLKNNGYASVQRDSIEAQVMKDSTAPYQLHVMFLVNPGRIFYFGDTYLNLSGPDSDIQYEEADTLSGPPHTNNDKTIYLQKEKEAQTRFSLLTDQLVFTPGEVFDNSKYIRTINEFQNLGMMNIRQFGLSRDGSLPDYTNQELPVLFNLQTIPKHSVNFNVFGMKRYGFGSGAGITYTNNNLFGKAENLSLSVNGSFEYVSSETLKDITPDSADNANSKFFQSLESRLEYSLPRLTFPFHSLDDNPFFSNGRTRYLFSLSQSDQLLFDINTDIRFNLRFEVNHSPRFSSALDLFELDLLDTEPTSRFEESLRQQFGEGSLEFQRVLEDFRPQISSIFRYSFRSHRTDLIKRNYGYFSEYSAAIGGNIPYLIDRYIITPDTTEGNLPPISSISGNSLSYSRFFKLTADYRRYIPLSTGSVFSFRGFLGFAHPYGKSVTIPLNQRFFAGGSNDIRGWSIYSLGPGGIALEDVTINGGEIKLLGQVEFRKIAIRNLFSANWVLAWFTDAGNIWYGPRNTFRGQDNEEILQEGKFFFDEFFKQIAVSSGIGIRLDFQYVVVRFDFPFRLHDLQEGWFENKNLYFNFGIGHSF